MNNIIHVIVEKVKREIEENIIKVLEGNANLDESLGIEKYERIEGNLKGDILDKATDVSYGNAAELSTRVPITGETVKKIIRENGAINNLELEIKEKRKVNTIYIEADEEHVQLHNRKNR